MNNKTIFTQSLWIADLSTMTCSHNLQELIEEGEKFFSIPTKKKLLRNFKIIYLRQQPH
jgi:hypothetical protein